MADAQRSTYHVTATTAPSGAGAAVHANAATIAFDGAAEPGGVLPGPAELLCAALAACLLKNVERFSHLLSFRYQAASVTVTATREDGPPRIVGMHYHLVVTTDEPDARLDLLHRNLLRHGTMTNTLAAACDVQGDLVRAVPDLP